MASRRVTYYFEVDSSGAVSGAGQAEGAIRSIDPAARTAAQGIDQAERSSSLFTATAVAVGNIAANAFQRVVRSLSGLPGQIHSIVTAMEETDSKFQTVLGAEAQRVNAFLEDFAHMAGLTIQESRELTATTASMVEGLGLVGEAGADLSMEVTRLAGDFASFNNIPIDETMSAIQSSLTGMHMPMRRLGVVIRESDVQQRAMAMSGKENADALTDQERAMATMSLIAERAGTTVGDLERTQDSAANTARRLSAEARELRNDLVQGFEPALNSSLALIERFTQSDMFDNLIAGLQAFIGNLATVPQFIDQNLERIVPMVQGVAAAIGLAGAAWIAYTAYANAAAIATAAATGGLTLIIAALAALIGILWNSEQAWQGLVDMVGGAWEIISTFFRNIPNDAEASMRVLLEILMLPWRLMVNNVRASVNSLISIVRGMVETVSRLVSRDWSGAMESIRQIGRDVADDYKTSFEGSFDGIRESISNLDADFGPAVERMKSGGRNLAEGIREGFNFGFEAEKENIMDTLSDVFDMMDGMATPSTPEADAGQDAGIENLRSIQDYNRAIAAEKDAFEKAQTDQERANHHQRMTMLQQELEDILQRYDEEERRLISIADYEAEIQDVKQQWREAETEEERQLHEERLEQLEIELEAMIEGLEVEDIMRRQMEEEEQERHEEMIRRLQQRRDMAASVINDLMGLNSALSDRRIAQIEEQRDRELANIERSLNQRNISERRQQELISQRARAEEDYDRRVSTIRKRQADQEKRWNIAQAIMNTAVAVTEALPNVILAGLAAVQGAIQVATVAAQPVPSFATGGLVPVMLSNGEFMFDPATSSYNIDVLQAMNANPTRSADIARAGLITGPGTGRSDSIMAMAEPGSFVLNAESTRNAMPVLNRLADGGEVDPVGRTVINTDQSHVNTLLESLIDRLENIEVHVTGEIHNDMIKLSNDRESDFEGRSKLKF